jgi:hypothetical protein
MIIFLLILIALILLFGRQAGIWFVLGSLVLIVIGIIIAAFMHADSSNNVGFVPTNQPQTLTPAQFQAIYGTVATPPKTKAVSAVPKTGYQVCGDTNATWDGYSRTSSGGFSCTCRTGYNVSADGKSCVIQNYYPTQYGASQPIPSFYNPYAQDEALRKQQEAATCAADAAQAKNMNESYIPPCYVY